MADQPASSTNESAYPFAGVNAHMLSAAYTPANTCYRDSHGRQCSCAPSAIAHFQKRISGPRVCG